MKKIVIVILSLAGLLLLGAQSAAAQAVAGYQNEIVGAEYGTEAVKPFSPILPSDNLMNESGMLRSNEWGPGPDPEVTPAVGQATPAGDGLWLLLGFLILFFLWKSRSFISERKVLIRQVLQRWE